MFALNNISLSLRYMFIGALYCIQDVEMNNLVKKKKN
jgi:hypothetical protein